MTKTELRDHFAGLLVQSLIGLADKTRSGSEFDETVLEYVDNNGWGANHPIADDTGEVTVAARFASDAYYIADAMLKEKLAMDAECPLD